jgi:hypothetical protein
MGGPCSTNGKKGNAYGLLVGKPEGKRPIGRPRRRWVDNIRMDLGEVGLGDVDHRGCFLLHNVHKFSSYLTGNTSPFCSQEFRPLDYRGGLLSST